MSKPANSASNMGEKFLSMFKGKGPIVPIILIGGGSLIIRPLIILSNKKEDFDKRLYAAVRASVTEAIALPLALLAGFAGAKFGKSSLICKNPKNAESLSTLGATAGFVIANLLIPSLTTKTLNSLPIKDVVSSKVKGRDGVDILPAPKNPTLGQKPAENPYYDTFGHAEGKPALKPPELPHAGSSYYKTPDYTVWTNKINTGLKI